MTVRMTHPDLPDAEIEVAESAVAVHRASGWRTDDENGSRPPATPPPPVRDPGTRTARRADTDTDTASSKE